METISQFLLDNMINLANLLYLVSYFVRDMLCLRLFTVLAASCLVAFFWSQPEPMLEVIAWNLFFIALNLFWSIRLLRQRTGRAWRQTGIAARLDCTRAHGSMVVHS